MLGLEITDTFGMCARQKAGALAGEQKTFLTDELENVVEYVKSSIFIIVYFPQSTSLSCVHKSGSY